MVVFSVAVPLRRRGPKGEGNLEQDSGLWGLGHGDLVTWYWVKKEEGAAGNVLGGGSSKKEESCS